jgi:hypothetical protein
MDRGLAYLQALEDPPEFNRRRAAVALIASVGIILAASLMVRLYPTSGFTAGYDAVIDRGGDWVRAQVDGDGGTALGVCDRLHREYEQTPIEPNYDYGTFIQGCSEAVDFLNGSPVPLLAAPGSQPD